jgi:ribosomal protein S18 acetylase RimI-like enzyme
VDNDLQFEELQACSGAEFQQFYALYAAAIAARERKSEDWVRQMCARADYKILLLKDRHDQNEVAGFSVLFLPPQEDFGLLEYMAVAAGHRNSGLGGKVFRQSLELARRAWRNQPRALLLEVDSDREAAPDRELRRRRLEFYRRLGCRALAGLDYIMPLPGEGPPPQMDLLVYSDDRRATVRKSEAEHWLQVIYREVYRCSPGDPRIAQMLGPLPDPIPLR